MVLYYFYFFLKVFKLEDNWCIFIKLCFNIYKYKSKKKINLLNKNKLDKHFNLLPLVLGRDWWVFFFFFFSWITRTGNLGLGRVNYRLLFGSELCWVCEGEEKMHKFQFLLSLKLSASMWLLYILTKSHNRYMYRNTFLIGGIGFCNEMLLPWKHWTQKLIGKLPSGGKMSNKNKGIQQETKNSRLDMINIYLNAHKDFRYLWLTGVS